MSLMCAEICSMSLENLHDALHLVKESSRGMSLEYDLDTVGLLTLSRFWNFCYDQSLLVYVNHEPAGIAIHCTDPARLEAYTYYWGVIPKFRSLRLSLQLAETCARKLRDGGYTTVHGDTVPDHPVRQWRFVHFYPQKELIDMQSDTPNLPAPNPEFQIREVPLELIGQLTTQSEQPVHWCQRPTFLRHAAPFLQFVGAFSGDVLTAYIICFRKPSGTTIWDLRSLDSSMPAGRELLRWVANNCPTPFTACYVFDNSYSHLLLTNAGFSVKRRFYSLTRDLLTTT